MTKLSEHFTLGEFIVCSTADKLGNDKYADSGPSGESGADGGGDGEGALRPRRLLDRITSDYRNPVSTTRSAGSPTAHALGHAADFRAAGSSVFGAVVKIRDAHVRGEIGFDQLILELRAASSTSSSIRKAQYEGDARRRPGPEAGAGRRSTGFTPELAGLVRTAGLEPARPEGQEILSLRRLPVPPRPHLHGMP